MRKKQDSETAIRLLTPGGDAAAVEKILDRLFPKRNLERVLLVNPPDADAALFQFATARRGRYTNYPPYGLMVIAANLRSCGVEVGLLNLNQEILRCCHEVEVESDFDFDEIWGERLDREMMRFRPDLVAVTCMFTMTHVSFRKVCRRVNEAGLPIAIGGVHVTNDLDRIVEDVGVVDVAFTGEGDHAIKSFVNAVNRKCGAEALGQVVLFDQMDVGGRSHYSFPADQRPGTDEISVIPAYDLVDLQDYSRYGTVGSFYFLTPPGTRFATVLSNRGCRAKCTFCSVRNFNGVGVRERSIDSVVDEFERLRDEFGIRHVMWLDDDLFYDHPRALALLTELAKRQLGITWDASNGILAASCTEELIDAAEASGCIGLHIGMESGNPEILRSVKKPANVAVLLRAAEVLRRHERIFSMVFLMIGFPNESMRKIWDTIRVAREMDLDWYKISQLQPLPNTPLFDSMVAQGLVKPAESGEVRYSLGGYGKQNEIEKGLRLSSPDFGEAFSSIPMDVEPNQAQLDDIWFFMNYHINFHRIFTEQRPTKQRQLLAILRNLTDVVAPEHGFALYFLAYLQQRTSGQIDAQIIERLSKRLEASSYWQNRLEAFGLSLEDLMQGQFADSENPLAVAAG